MALKVNELVGVSEELGAALRDLGLNDSDKLLAAAGRPKDRQELAAKLGVEEGTLLELANRADLARIKGIGRVYSDLLEFAGVDTVIELAGRNPDNLYEKIMEVASDHSVQRTPRRDQVHDWVAQAKELPRAIHYS